MPRIHRFAIAGMVFLLLLGVGVIFFRQDTVTSVAGGGVLLLVAAGLYLFVLHVDLLRRSLMGLVEQSYDGIVLTDSAGRIEAWNPGMERITGRQRDRKSTRLNSS